MQLFCKKTRLSILRANRWAHFKAWRRLGVALHANYSFVARMGRTGHFVAVSFEVFAIILTRVPRCMAQILPLIDRRSDIPTLIVF